MARKVTQQCTCCSCQRSHAIPFSPCVVCGTFVCGSCRGEPITALVAEPDDRRAWVCRTCVRVYRGQTILVAWNERGEPRLAAGPDKPNRVPPIASSARARCVSLG